jgi:hypothetical protein
MAGASQRCRINRLMMRKERAMNPDPQQAATDTPPTKTEQYQLTGEDVITKIRQIVHEGNVRRVLIRNAEGHIIVEFPLTIGVVGAALAPMWAALGAIVALVSDCTIEIERREHDLDKH